MPRLLPAVFLAFAGIVAATSVARSADDFESICPYQGQHQQRISEVMGVDPSSVPFVVQRYCKNIGKEAHKGDGWKIVQKFEIGTIEDLTFVEAGQVDSDKEGDKWRTVRPGLYYVIAPGKMYRHRQLRYAPELKAK